ncbi:uncharacterized protein LOC123542999 [Mercenaria mercenaria]|uniref:uncharacterized protein LOC123542999 n=1 Tax=Mercenaria mercenaria TaxID=6596 RepID=UPI00234EF0D2|nr:uncharacterized protein LOC123542999 [Mercenaria mercenaria]
MKSTLFLIVCITFQKIYVAFNTQEGGVNISFNVTRMSTCRTEKDMFRRILGVGLPNCVRECGLRSHCEALCYRRKLQICDLFTTSDGGKLSNGDCIFIARSEIKIEKTPCGVCPHGKDCDINSKVCIFKECSRMEINNGVVLGNVNTRGSTVRYKCNNGYRDMSRLKTGICQEDGTWNMSANCKKEVILKDCSEVKECNSSYADGEYWLFPDVLEGHKVKIFCSGMSTSSPSEYISVDQDHNYGFDAGAINTVEMLTRYMKIRVNVKTMEIDCRDTTFTDPPSSSFHYARASGCKCRGGCQPYQGYFNISTVGTGLRFNDEVIFIHKICMSEIAD